MPVAADQKPLKGTTAFSFLTHALAVKMPQRLTRSRNARRGIRSLKGTGR